MGYGQGGLFRSVARAVTPMVKSGAKALGNSGANLVGDVLAGKNVKEAAKAHTREVADVAKQKAVQRLRTYASNRKLKTGWKTTSKKKS